MKQMWCFFYRSSIIFCIGCREKKVEVIADYGILLYVFILSLFLGIQAPCSWGLAGQTLEVRGEGV